MNRTRLWHGAAYYPELWPEDVQKEDIRLMAELGFNCVRMGEFAWSTMEPRAGEFHFAWLTSAMDRLHAAGISTILCTPTATPPQWILKQDPGIGYVEPKGYRHGHGGRQHACYSHPAYRAHSRRITEAMAKALGAHPGLIAWQTDNEFRCHQTLCVCPACQAAWPHWLERRYGSIQRLNTLWGTAIWSENCESFHDVPVLHPTPVHHQNYSLETAYRNFMSDMVVEFQDEQILLIRRHSRAPIGHNFPAIDNAEQYRNLDFVGADFYNSQAETPALQWDYDWMRALKPGIPFRVMETGADMNGFAFHPDNYLRAKIFLTYTAGADLQSYWLWRQQRSGVELEHSCIVHACGKPRRAWREVAKAEAMRQRLEPLLRRFSPAPAQAVLVRSERHGRYLFEDGMNKPTKDFGYWNAIRDWHRALLESGAQRDVAYDSEIAPAQYRIVFSPYLAAVSDDFLNKMADAVRDGCHWIIGPHCGFRTVENTVPTDAILGPMEALFGFETLGREAAPSANIRLADDSVVSVPGGRLTAFRAGPDIEILGRYEDGPLSGEAWGIAKAFGAGRVVAIGSELPQDVRSRIAKALIAEAGVETADIPWGVIVNHQRDGAGHAAWALANWTPEEISVPLPKPARDLMTDAPLADEARLPAFGCCLAQFQPDLA